MNTKKPITQTTKTLKARMLEVGKCLEWQGYFQNGTPYVSHRGKMVSVRRLFLRLMGKKINEGGYVVPSCGNKKCVSHHHAIYKTTKEMMTDIASNATQSINKKRKVQKYQHTKAKLDWEKVQEIRFSNLSIRQLSREFNINKSQISRIRRGESWKNYENNPFAGLL